VEAWSSPAALSQCFSSVDVWDPPNGASQLYNAMIHPLHPMPIYGAIWYQGESNTHNANLYACAITAMVNGWRSNWHTRSPEINPAFPFGQVQLAPWRPQDIVDGFTNMRWYGQTNGLGYTPNDLMNNFFLAVAIDLPDYDSPYGDIHPRYKRQIADRLSLAAEYVAYGEADGGLYQGPQPTSIGNEGAQIRLTYGTQLQFRNTGSGFELCCGASAANTCGAGGNWAAASFLGGSGNEVTISIPCGGQVVTGFRYLWRESPCALEQCPIYSVQNNLPAVPYLYNGALLAGQTVAV
jgi:sialate O-acetylesterase